METIIASFPPLSQNNAREIVRNLLVRFMEKPSYRLEQRLNNLGIGIDWTTPEAEGVSKPENIYLLGTVEDFELDDETLGNLLK